MTKRNIFSTRLAPSPTGQLHMGHVAHVIWVFGIAQKLNATVQLRIEDHDTSRCRPEFESSILEDLAWLGVPNSSISAELWRQSERHERYKTVAKELIDLGLVYACNCSRKEIANAAGQTGGELHYPGTCRRRGLPLDEPDTSLRVIMPDQTFDAWDLRHGALRQNPQKDCGDLVIRDRQGSWTYQFCVVIDDLDQGINLIIRGDDLLSSVGRQLALRAMIRSDALSPFFFHHSLLLNEKGEKLSKRAQSEGLAARRTDGWSGPQMLGHVAKQIGLQGDESPVALSDVMMRTSLHRLEMHYSQNIPSQSQSDR